MADETNNKIGPKRREEIFKRRKGTNESSENMSYRECAEFMSGTFCFISNMSCSVWFLESDRSKIYKKPRQRSHCSQWKTGSKMSGEKKTRFLSCDSQKRPSLGQHIEFSLSNLGWKKQIGSFLLSLISLPRGFPPPQLPCTGWSTDLSQHLCGKVRISFRRWTTFSAWTELAKPPKTKSPSSCSEGRKLFSGPIARCPSVTVRLSERDSERIAGRDQTFQTWHWRGLWRNSETENLVGDRGKKRQRGDKEKIMKEREWQNSYAG